MINQNLLSQWGQALGFSSVGISQADTSVAAPRLQAWLAAGRQGEMRFMAEHAALRSNPAQLVPGTVSAISVTLPYWPNSQEIAKAQDILHDPLAAYVSRYALGRDYHKVFRQKLQKLADQIENHIGPFGYRVFSDSAPVFEVEFATQARLGWRGKHSLLLNRTGSWFFLGEIYTDLPLEPAPLTQSADQHCGSCTRCIHACPTGAIFAPYQVDARRCISYLTIEHHGPIPEELRPLLGNRIYGCDDCQLVCPWNRFTQPGNAEFQPRQQLDRASLLNLFSWTEDQFNERLAGNPIRRIGYERWLRNIAVALGNALRGASDEDRATLLTALHARHTSTSAMVQEHIAWAISQCSPEAFTVQSKI